ncbi:MAG TPA: hypothetical protein VJL84_04115, partial [Kiloniellales bacterium]|nr:hypothetical protein [Kiloniellales bacterium]
PLPERGDEPTAPTDRGEEQRVRSRRRRGKRGGRRRNRQREGQEGPPQAARAEDGPEFDGQAPEFDAPGTEDQGWESEPEPVEEAVERERVEVEETVATEPEWRLTEDPAAEETSPESVRAERKPTPIDVVTEPEPGQPRKRGWWNRLVR